MVRARVWCYECDEDNRTLCNGRVRYAMVNPFFFLHHEKQEIWLKDMKRYLVVKGEMITAINKAR